ncbi:MAG: tetratricopeptide repeat protein [Thiohalorhabdus sp.]|uniref:tetratricopeptide repeat protein n=1 Tax=Thiohalorhabdus sp. TaxID=3094134 RepID=UPI00397EFCF5
MAHRYRRDPRRGKGLQAYLMGGALLGTLGVSTAPAAGDGEPSPLPEEARNLLGHGQEYARNHQWRAAIALYRDAIDMDPRQADAHLELGVALAQEDRPRASARALKRATELRPDSAKAFYNLGVAYAHSGETRKEMEAYREAIRLDPEHISAHYNLGTAHWGEGRDGKASREFYEAGKLYQEAGHPRMARQMLQLIREIAPDSEYRGRLERVVEE